MAVVARQRHIALAQHTGDPPGRAQLQKAAEHQCDPVLHLLVRVLDDHARGVAYQPGRQLQRQLAPASLVEQARGEAAADRVQLQFGDRALEPKQEPPVGQARVVDRVAVSDQTAAVAADVEQRIPVRAVAREAGDLDGDDQADLAQGDARDQVLEALPVRRRRGAQAKVGIDHLDIRLTPAPAANASRFGEVAGALAQGVLQAQAFLVAQHLMRGGLAHVDHGAAVQVV